MVYESFEEMIDKAKKSDELKISVAMASDREVLKTVKSASELGIATFILVGNAGEIDEIAGDINLDTGKFEVIDESNPARAAVKAARQITEGNADSLMKGLVNTSDFMKAVLNKEAGLRSGKLLSHLAAFEIPTYDKILFTSDGGINVDPDLEQKKQILGNAVDFLSGIGYEDIKVAILAANEKVSSAQPVTIEAAALKVMAERGEFEGAKVDGPLALDLALSEEAAEHKNIDSEVAGNADLVITPNIEAGNVLGKSLSYCAQATMAGIILGIKVPVILTSRAASRDEKIASISMATLLNS